MWGVMSSREAATSGIHMSEKTVAISTGLLALALGSGLGATPADAALITQQLNVDVPVGTSVDFGRTSPPFGVSDPGQFTVTNLGVDGGVLGIGLQGNTTGLSTNLVAVKAGGGSPPLLDFFNPGDPIDSSLTFGPQGIDFFFQNQNTGLIKAVNNVVYGLQTTDVSDSFGFLQLDVLPSADIHLDFFAFQDTPGEPAVVIPEPGTLSLFAVGGAALLAARRRRKQQKTA